MRVGKAAAQVAGTGNWERVADRGSHGPGNAAHPRSCLAEDPFKSTPMFCIVMQLGVGDPNALGWPCLQLRGGVGYIVPCLV